MFFIRDNPFVKLNSIRKKKYRNRERKSASRIVYIYIYMYTRRFRAEYLLATSSHSRVLSFVKKCGVFTHIHDNKNLYTEHAIQRRLEEGCRWSLTEFRAVDHIPPELGHALMHRCRRHGANGRTRALPYAKQEK